MISVASFQTLVPQFSGGTEIGGGELANTSTTSRMYGEKVLWLPDSRSLLLLKIELTECS